MAAEAKVVGIDLGTTYSCIAYFEDGLTHIVSVDNRPTMASTVVFTGDPYMGKQGLLVGNTAKTESWQYPKHTVFDVKRMLGRSFDDPKLTAPKRTWPFDIYQTKENNIKLEVRDSNGDERLVAPEEISSLVLDHLLDAEERRSNGERPSSAVITVPAYFNDAQRQATRDAAALSGLTVKRLINEPTAAAIAYGLSKPRLQERQVLVFDLGGGTFDISLLSMKGHDVKVLATTGDDQLGGNDFDQRILDWLIQELMEDVPGVDTGADTAVVARLRAKCEEAKVEVNKIDPRDRNATMPWRIRVREAVPGRDFERVLTTEKFNSLNDDLFQLCFRGNAQGRGGLDEFFGPYGAGGNYNRANVQEILTVGGSTNIPRIRHLLSDYFDGNDISTTLNADEAVARGAAAVAAIITRDPTVLTDGTAPMLLDVCPHTLGIRLFDGSFSRIILKNTPVPARVSVDTYTTLTNTQTEVDIEVFQGEALTAEHKDNFRVGTFKLQDIVQPGGDRMPQLRVTMELDNNCMLRVTAQDITADRRGKPVKGDFSIKRGTLAKDELEDLVVTKQVAIENNLATF